MAFFSLVARRGRKWVNSWQRAWRGLCHASSLLLSSSWGRPAPPSAAGRVPGTTAQPGCFPKAPPLPSCPLLPSHFHCLPLVGEICFFYNPPESKSRSTRGMKKQSWSPISPPDLSHPNEPSAAPTFLRGAGEGRNNWHRIIAELKLEVLPQLTGMGETSHIKPWVDSDIHPTGASGKHPPKTSAQAKIVGQHFSHRFLCSLLSFLHFTRDGSWEKLILRRRHQTQTQT